MNRFVRSMPVLLVPDVTEPVAFWIGKLGFATGGIWGEPPSFAIVGRNSISVGLDKPDSFTPNASSGWSAYLYIDDTIGYAEELAARGVALLCPLEDTFYGCRELTIEVPGGHRIAFGTDLNPGPDGPGL